MNTSEPVIAGVGIGLTAGTEDSSLALEMERVESMPAKKDSEVRRNHYNPWGSSLKNPSQLLLLKEVRIALRKARTVLDVGCGNCSPLRFFPDVSLTGVDGYGPALEEARRNGTHNEYFLGDVRNLTGIFPGRKFEVCIALDVIEHLSKEDGWRMLESMERLATRRVVIFTPNGFLPQKSHDGDLQQHLSGWTADEMRARGYEVLGMFGPKSLRGEYHRINRQPRIFWLLVSILGHYTSTRRCPEKAAAIFCVKKLQP